MEFSGERFIPHVEGDIQLEHMHRYLAVRRLVSGKRVLDIACGEGYGSDILGKTAATVTGVDIDDKCTYFKDGNFYYKTSISSTSALVVPYVGKMTRYAGQSCSSKFCCMEGFNIQCKGV